MGFCDNDIIFDYSHTYQRKLSSTYAPLLIPVSQPTLKTEIPTLLRRPYSVHDLLLQVLGPQMVDWVILNLQRPQERAKGEGRLALAWGDEPLDYRLPPDQPPGVNGERSDSKSSRPGTFRDQRAQPVHWFPHGAGRPVRPLSDSPRLMAKL